VARFNEVEATHEKRWTRRREDEDEEKDEEKDEKETVT
jgi:hypothetical protein